MKICVSLTDDTTDGVIERMKALAAVADMFEVRADLVLDLDLLAILRARTQAAAAHLPVRVRGRPLGGRRPAAAAHAAGGGEARATTTWTSSTAAGSST